jgi:hypothetical protein
MASLAAENRSAFVEMVQTMAGLSAAQKASFVQAVEGTGAESRTALMTAMGGMTANQKVAFLEATRDQATSAHCKPGSYRNKQHDKNSGALCPQGRYSSGFNLGTCRACSGGQFSKRGSSHCKTADSPAAPWSAAVPTPRHTVAPKPTPPLTAPLTQPLTTAEPTPLPPLPTQPPGGSGISAETKKAYIKSMLQAGKQHAVFVAETQGMDAETVDNRTAFAKSIKGLDDRAITEMMRAHIVQSSNKGITVMPSPRPSLTPRHTVAPKPTPPPTALLSLSATTAPPTAQPTALPATAKPTPDPNKLIITEVSQCKRDFFIWELRPCPNCPAVMHCDKCQNGLHSLPGAAICEPGTPRARPFVPTKPTAPIIAVRHKHTTVHKQAETAQADKAKAKAQRQALAQVQAYLHHKTAKADGPKPQESATARVFRWPKKVAKAGAVDARSDDDLAPWAHGQSAETTPAPTTTRAPTTAAPTPVPYSWLKDPALAKFMRGGSQSSFDTPPRLTMRVRHCTSFCYDNPMIKTSTNLPCAVGGTSHRGDTLVMDVLGFWRGKAGAGIHGATSADMHVFARFGKVQRHGFTPLYSEHLHLLIR